MVMRRRHLLPGDTLALSLLMDFGPGGLRAPCVLACTMRSLAIVIPNFRSHCFFLLRFLLLTHFGESPVCEIILPQYFGITRRYKVNFIFFKEKKVIFGRFFCFLRPAFGHCRLGHPQSLEYLWLQS